MGRVNQGVAGIGHQTSHALNLGGEKKTVTVYRDTQRFSGDLAQCGTQPAAFTAHIVADHGATQGHIRACIKTTHQLFAVIIQVRLHS